MDEPTSALTEREVAHLFEIIRDLRGQGKGIVYITHKMNELFEIADEVSVFRDGRYIGTHASSDVTRDDIIRMMVGREITQMFPKEEVPIGEVVLSVRDLTPRRRLPRCLLRRARRRDPRRRRPRRLGALQRRRDAVRRDAGDQRHHRDQRPAGRDRLARQRRCATAWRSSPRTARRPAVPAARRAGEHADRGAAASATSRGGFVDRGELSPALRGDERRRCASRRRACTSGSRTCPAATSRRC